MKRFENGNALAKEFGLPPAVLKKTFEDYNQIVRTKKDPFGKKVSVVFQTTILVSHSPQVLPRGMDFQ